ncbi:hypothetical protein AB1L07_01880 [Niallia alba]|uniref:hypothetical protein n=1 Tax=Niallia alba TaxID=2729105 RepID=UPI00399F8D0D
MSEYKVKTINSNGNVEYETLYSYCSRLSKKNNSLLYRLENYLSKKLLDDPELTEIRDIILTVSADVSKIQNMLVKDGDDYERLQ